MSLTIKHNNFNPISNYPYFYQVSPPYAPESSVPPETLSLHIQETASNTPKNTENGKKNLNTDTHHIWMMIKTPFLTYKMGEGVTQHFPPSKTTCSSLVIAV